jgi:exonuclease III
MQVVVGLGGMMGPGGQEIPPNMEIAKHHIDLLDVLDRKTRNNLEKDERAMLDTTLHQLRMAYVETVRAMSGGPPPGPV